jgi:hypothetical protein
VGLMGFKQLTLLKQFPPPPPPPQFYFVTHRDKGDKWIHIRVTVQW